MSARKGRAAAAKAATADRPGEAAVPVASREGAAGEAVAAPPGGDPLPAARPAARPVRAGSARRRAKFVF